MYTFCHRSTYCKCSNNINVLSTSEELEGNIGQSTNRQRHFIIHLCKIRIFQYFCGRISCTYLDYNYFRLFTKTRRLKLRHLQYFIENKSAFSKSFQSTIFPRLSAKLTILLSLSNGRGTEPQFRQAPVLPDKNRQMSIKVAQI